LFLGVYTPPDGPEPLNTALDLPKNMGLSILHGIPAIGTKFRKPENLGPQSQPNKASGKYEAAVYFYFDNTAEKGQNIEQKTE